MIHYFGSLVCFFPNQIYISHDQIKEGVDINILMFIPAVIIGVIGGLMGSLFTIVNLKIHRLRKRNLAAIKKPWLVKFVRLAEPALVMVGK